MSLKNTLPQNVSRETISKLERYAALVMKWNAAINLIAKNLTEKELWERHIDDSLQLAPLMTPGSRILDLGSGGGLPGIVLACHGYPVTLVESDQRKCVFLQEAIRLCEVAGAQVICARIEAIPPQNCDVITARALASLTDLLGYAQPHLGISTQCFFPKGKSWRKEVEEARGRWQFEWQEHPSLTHSESIILQLSQVRPIP